MDTFVVAHLRNREDFVVAHLRNREDKTDLFLGIFSTMATAQDELKGQGYWVAQTWARYHLTAAQYVDTPAGKLVLTPCEVDKLVF